MLPRYYEFYHPVKVLSGVNALENLSYELEHLQANRPMLITNRELTHFGLTGVVEDVLRSGGITIAARFEEIPPDSSVHVVNAAGCLFRDAGCDAIIALGGGSVIDTANPCRPASPRPRAWMPWCTRSKATPASSTTPSATPMPGPRWN